MEAKAVLGKDLMLFVDGKALALSTSCKLTISAETVDTQSKDSGIWMQKDIKKMSWNASSDNLFTIDNQESSYDSLHDAMINRKQVNLIFGIAANANELGVPAGGWLPPTGKQYKGVAIITSLDLNAPDGDKASYTVSFDGTGPMLVNEDPETLSIQDSNPIIDKTGDE